MWVEVTLVESAPWKMGSETQEFIGVGPQIFAIPCLYHVVRRPKVVR
jgi:hypothetical protein